MSIGHPILEIQLFQNLTLKIQGQGHGWGQSLKSQCESSIISTHIPFVPCQSAIPFLRYDFFKIWPWKFKVKVIEEVNIESHHMGPTFYRLTSFSFHVNRPFHSWDTAFPKFDLENPRSRSNDLMLHKSIQWFQRYGFRKVWPKCCLIWHVLGQWASPYGANGQIIMTVHNYRSRQVHKTLSGVNPSSSFRDMRSAKSRPNLWQIWQVFGPWASLYGGNGQMTMTVHIYRPRQFHRTSNGENPSSGYRDMSSASVAAARPNRDDNTPPARRAGG